MPLEDALKGIRAVISDVTRFVGDVYATATKSPAKRATAPTKAIPQALLNTTNKQLARAFANGWHFSIVIPGEHSSGLSNQELLEVRGNEGREFAAETVQLTQYLRKEMQERFAGYSRVVAYPELLDLADKLTVNYIANERVLGGGGDITLVPLTAAYAEYKRKKGKGGKPIGVWSGKWLNALRRQGHAVPRGR